VPGAAAEPSSSVEPPQGGGADAAPDESQEIPGIIEVEEVDLAELLGDKNVAPPVGTSPGEAGAGAATSAEASAAPASGDAGGGEPGGENAESLLAKGVDHHERGELDLAIDIYGE